MPIFPEDMDPVGRKLRELERRLAAVERGRNPLARATLDDEDGNRRINFGALDDDSFGVEILDEDGNTVFRVDEGGLAAPNILVPVISETWESAESSLAFPVGLWRCMLPAIPQPAIRWTQQVTIVNDVTFACRLNYVGPTGSTSTDDIVVTTGSHILEWNWAPSWEIGEVGLLTVPQISMEVERTAGDEWPILAFLPAVMLGTVEQLGATPTGLPS